MSVELIALVANILVMLGGAISIVQNTRAQQKIIDNKLEFMDTRLDGFNNQLGVINGTLLIVARQDERLTNHAARMDRLEARIDERDSNK